MGRAKETVDMAWGGDPQSRVAGGQKVQGPTPIPFYKRGPPPSISRTLDGGSYQNDDQNDDSVGLEAGTGPRSRVSSRVGTPPRTHESDDASDSNNVLGF
jgi:hypothetical protein